MSEKFSLKEVIKALLDEVKAALQEYTQNAQTQLKNRLKKLLMISIISAILMSLGISLAGSAALFILIGSLRYLQTTMPAWQAWLIMGTTSAITATAFFIALVLIIRKQLSSSKTPPEQKVAVTQEK
jgi:ABC-type multidrug transport system permease subunit